MIFIEQIKYHKLLKSQSKEPRWLDKKVDMQGVVFLAGSRLYIRYVEGLPKTYNAVDRTSYDAIKYHNHLEMIATANSGLNRND